MNQSFHTGFSLFPLPPTPPANKQRTTRVLRDQQEQEVEALPRYQPEAFVESSEKHPLKLRPAPLKLRKRRSSSKHTLPKQTLRVVNPDPKTPDQSVVDLPREIQPAFQTQTFSFPQSPSIPPTPISSPTFSEELTPWPAFVAENSHFQATPCPQPLLKRKSYRSSQWIDTNGQVDRKKLSVYLSKALDSSFQVIDAVESDDLFQTPALRSPRPESNYGWCKRTLATEPVQPPSVVPFSKEPSKRAPSYYEDVPQQFAALKHQTNIPSLPTSTVSRQCGCPPGVLLCKTCSSQEFENFRRRLTEHKPNPSVSSTKCLLSVPRARFRTTLTDLEELTSPSSPPELMFDSDDGDDSDWSVPGSPDRIETPVAAMQETPTPAPRLAAAAPAPAIATTSTGPAVPRPNAVSRSNVPSFSLPFSHGRQIRPRMFANESNRNSARDTLMSSSSPTSTVPTLASISTISTFTFDFATKAGCDDDTATEYDPFDDGSEVSEIRTYEPVQKAKPTLVHCRGPSPVTIKYSIAPSYRSRGQESGDSGYQPIYV